MREIILDTETTGLKVEDGHKIIEIGAIEIISGIKTGQFFHTYINPNRHVPIEAFRIHGISTEFLLDKPSFKDIAKDFLDFIQDSPLIIHNARFDLGFLNYELKNIQFPSLERNKVVDTLMLARKKLPGSPASLDALCKRFAIDLSIRKKHGALLDAELLAEVYIELMGGRQTKMEFLNSSALSEMENMVSNKKFYPSRNYKLEDEEIERHENFLKMLPNNIW